MFATSTILTIFLALGAVAAPLESRQTGNLQCNIARLKTVGSLSKAGSAIKQIQDPATQSAAQTGLDMANGGIQTIASALLSGQTAPADGRNNVAAGLQAMNATLSAADA